MKPVRHVVCLWTRVPSGAWVLQESYQIDRDGYPLSRDVPEATNGYSGRCSWDGWVRDRKGEPIPHRAVTLWTVADGIQLVELYLGACDGLDIEEVRNKIGIRNFGWLSRGYELYFGTEKEARKFLDGEGEN